MSSHPLPSTSAFNKTDYVSAVPNTGVVYVIVADQKKFDQINRPVTQHPLLPDGRRVLSKTIGNWDMASADGLVIFQYWLDAPANQTFNGKPA